MLTRIQTTTVLSVLFMILAGMAGQSTDFFIGATVFATAFCITVGQWLRLLFKF